MLVGTESDVRCRVVVAGLDRLLGILRQLLCFYVKIDFYIHWVLIYVTALDLISYQIGYFLVALHVECVLCLHLD